MMLLPSDVARLVLGYLQEEGLTATSQAFIHESPNLREYAEHTTGDGIIPACVFSIFGKGLTTILNEYMAAKSRDSSREVPLMMTSLWKKLDFTVNQIKSLQNSPAISASQRTRSRIGLANMARQRVLTMASSGSVICSTVSETSSIFSPAHTANSMLSHSTPVSYTAPHARLAPVSDINQQIHDGCPSRDSPIHIVVSEHRLNPGPLSPGRRKWDTPRKRGAAPSGSNGPARSATAASSLSAEPQPEEQLVIQNARDKILGDRSLQEKLAENINKILANEPLPQTSKASLTTEETDQSIDEILGLQGEIHMSDDAIHDILEQTESDPAFQALFDLFEYNKTKFPDGDPGEGDISSSPEESDTAGSSATVRPLQSEDQGTKHKDTSVSDTTAVTVKPRAGQDRKTRKSGTLLKKTLLAPSGRSSRIEGSSARLLVSHREHRAVPAAAGDSNRNGKSPLLNDGVGVTPMDVDEPLNTPPLECIVISEPAAKDSFSAPNLRFESTRVPSPRGSPAVFAQVTTSSCNVEKIQEHTHAQGSTPKPATAPSLVLSIQPAFLSPVQVELSTPTPTADLSVMPVSISGGETQLASTPTSSRVTAAAVAPSPSLSTVRPPMATPASPRCSSASTHLAAAPGSSISASPADMSTCVPVSPASGPSPANLSGPGKAAADSSGVVSLKIIISDNPEEGSSSDATLNQAISSISGDKIPTIYLSSPAKSPGTLPCPGTPRANVDEVAQAVSGLQNSEVFASPLSAKSGALLASPSPATPQAQQSYIIQLPMDAANPALQGAPGGFFLLTEPPTADARTRPVLLPAGVAKGQPLSNNHLGGTTPTQGFSNGSALILKSPVKPMVLPISVMGQNTLGSVQVVPNQLVTIPSPVSVQQSETPVKSNMAIKQSSIVGTEENLVVQEIQPLPAENTDQQDAAKSSSHRRILRFDSSAEVQPRTSTPSPTAANKSSTSKSVRHPEKATTPTTPRTKPAILGGNKPKRRVEFTRCSANPQSSGGLFKESQKSLQQHHKDTVKKNPRKQHLSKSQESPGTSTGSADSSQSETLKKLTSRRRSIDRKRINDDDETKSKDAQSCKSSSSDSASLSDSKPEKEENGRKDLAEKPPAKAREGRTEKKPPSQEVPNVTANKENEIKSGTQEQQQQSTSSASSASRDFSPPAVTSPLPNPQSKASKAPSKTSSLVKQAAEMLHDIQGLNSAPSPVKRPGVATSDPCVPRAAGSVRIQEQPLEGPRTPSRKKRGKDGEGTPRRLMPPNTPDVPTCSPASETGSESSINMAAHTLMILSRAAIARTGTPLKDSLRQEGAGGEKSPTSSKNAKKRKQPSPTASPPTKKESKRSPSKKKERDRKKLVDCFPLDLDVDKFLSSLHYDE